MNKRVYLLAIISFVVGMVELIIGGLLDLVAADLHITLGKAGFLMTVFSLSFAIAGPVILTMTQKIERKKLTQICLFVFLIGNLVAVVSPVYSILILSRIITAACAALLIALCLTIVPTIVEKKYRARAISIVFMGVSASLVLGVPFGLMLGNVFGWRAPFVMISILTFICMLGVHFFLGNIESKPAVPIMNQLRSLKKGKIVFAQATSFIFIAGHLTFYGYLTPYLKTVMGMDGTWVSIVYLIFGIAAVAGGGIGGMMADRLGPKSAIFLIVISFAVCMFMIPASAVSVPLFLILLSIYGMLSWAITPAIQTYLIELSRESSDIQQTLNNSAVHMGIAFGSFVGGIVIEQSSVNINPIAGGFIVIFSFAAAVISMGRRNKSFLPGES